MKNLADLGDMCPTMLIAYKKAPIFIRFEQNVIKLFF